MAMVRIALLNDAGAEQDSFVVECDSADEAEELYAELESEFEDDEDAEDECAPEEDDR